MLFTFANKHFFPKRLCRVLITAFLAIQLSRVVHGPWPVVRSLSGTEFQDAYSRRGRDSCSEIPILEGWCDFEDHAEGLLLHSSLVHALKRKSFPSPLLFKLTSVGRMESSKSTSVRPVYRSPTREARRAAIHRVEHEYELF